MCAVFTFERMFKKNMLVLFILWYKIIVLFKVLAT